MTNTPPDPDDFGINADHDGEMDLACPVHGCGGWWVAVLQGSSIREQRDLAHAHIAEKHSEALGSKAAQ
ncbi:hypothetical protein GCM10010172_80150 [Paractinoplanes ferrugineus]|uniref:Uncharacterized protein n=1 Tax=Paractinoplanes ferrugineus TaxID=113564 RepID=A0A919JGE3_9ACTN|nr:hypothetical protein [Actinoplanes ferrugineus]GIE16731.1 hypothetical protein Afe05nite_85710 [Actinoplanes ferrugineus]